MATGAATDPKYTPRPATAPQTPPIKPIDRSKAKRIRKDQAGK